MKIYTYNLETENKAQLPSTRHIPLQGTFVYISKNSRPLCTYPYINIHMDVKDMIDILSALWPMLLGTGTLIVILAKMHYSIEVLKEKVKILFDFHNNKRK